MSRLTRDHRLETREARSRLKTRRPPYWRSVHKGLAIGYRKGEKGGVWMVRKQASELAGGYHFRAIGNADDHQDANGIDVLDYQQAHRKALELSDRQTEGRGTYTVGDAARDYLEWAKAHIKSARATEATINTHILPHFKDRRVESLRTADLERWKNTFVRSPMRRRGKGAPKLVEVGEDPDTIRRRKATCNRVLTILRAILNRAWEHGKVADNSQWKRVKPFENVEEARKIFLQPDECKRLINAAQGAFRSYVRALLYTGARPGKELEFVRVCDFDQHAGILRIPDGKTGARDVFLSDEGVRFFAGLATGRGPDDLLLVRDDSTAWANKSWVRPMKAAVTAAKLPAGTNLYSLRHTFVSIALKNGMNVKVLADSCGTSLRMIEKHYAKFLNADRRKMFNKALPSLGLPKGNVRSLR